jgi:hypothetical protein
MTREAKIYCQVAIALMLIVFVAAYVWLEIVKA